MENKKQAAKLSEFNDGLGYVEKPPLGLVPRRNYDFSCNQQRMQDIIMAMKRYTSANKPIPQEWLEELSERICWVSNAALEGRARQ